MDMGTYVIGGGQKKRTSFGFKLSRSSEGMGGMKVSGGGRRFWMADKVSVGFLQ